MQLFKINLLLKHKKLPEKKIRANKFPPFVSMQSRYLRKFTLPHQKSIKRTKNELANTEKNERLLLVFYYHTADFRGRNTNYSTR